MAAQAPYQASNRGEPRRVGYMAGRGRTPDRQRLHRAVVARGEARARQFRAHLCVFLALLASLELARSQGWYSDFMSRTMSAIAASGDLLGSVM